MSYVITISINPILCYNCSLFINKAVWLLQSIYEIGYNRKVSYNASKNNRLSILCYNSPESLLYSKLYKSSQSYNILVCTNPVLRYNYLQLCMLCIYAAVLFIQALSRLYLYLCWSILYYNTIHAHLYVVITSYITYSC